ncbi:MAG: LPS export ABC transporter periplasmic protein LptC [Alphaproteobacteria bacterium]|nr:LPS export ABC transporter periplasmic protein LptC [Alphaproteobacteria bacterium]
MENPQQEHKKYLARKKLIGRGLKIFLVAIILILVVYMSINLFLGKGRALFFNLIASNLLNIEVKPAIIAGITESGLKYNITSETIENYISSFFYKNNIDFSKPIIKLELNDGNVVNISSKSGQFDEAKNVFFLKDRVELLSSDGAFLESSLITLNISKGEIYTNEKTTARDGNNFLYSKGFLLANNFNHLTVFGPIVVSDTKITEENLYKYNIFNEIYFQTSGNIFIDNIKRTASTDNPFFGFRSAIKYSADSFKVNYINIDRFKNSKNVLDNFSRIEMADNVKVYNNKNHGTLRGDKYIYDVLKQIMILTSKGLTTYEDDNYIFSVNDRLEFNVAKNTAVARGNPHLSTKSDADKKFDITARLAYAKLEPITYNILYAEIFDNIVVRSYDDSTIYADYGYLDYVENILYLEDNIKIQDSQNNVIEGCKLILDIVSGKTRLIKCDDQSGFQATINRSKAPN